MALRTVALLLATVVCILIVTSPFPASAEDNPTPSPSPSRSLPLTAGNNEATNKNNTADGTPDDNKEKNQGNLLTRILPPILIIGIFVAAIMLALWYCRRRRQTTFVEAVMNDNQDQEITM